MFKEVQAKTLMISPISWNVGNWNLSIFYKG